MKKYIIISLVIVLIFIMFMPLLLNNNQVICSHDIKIHINRINALTEQIIMGKPFIRMNPTLLEGLGYPYTLCYPDVFLYIPAFLAAVGINIITAYYIFLMLCMISMFASTYYCVKNIVRNKNIAFFSAMAYCFFSYTIFCVFERGALGEVQSFIFIPFIIYGIYDMFFHNLKKYIL